MHVLHKALAEVEETGEHCARTGVCVEMSVLSYNAGCVLYEVQA